MPETRIVWLTLRIMSVTWASIASGPGLCKGKMAGAATSLARTAPTGSMLEVGGSRVGGSSELRHPRLERRRSMGMQTSRPIDGAAQSASAAVAPSGGTGCSQRRWRFAWRSSATAARGGEAAWLQRSRTRAAGALEQPYEHEDKTHDSAGDKVWYALGRARASHGPERRGLGNDEGQQQREGASDRGDQQENGDQDQAAAAENAVQRISDRAEPSPARSARHLPSSDRLQVARTKPGDPRTMHGSRQQPHMLGGGGA